MPALSTLNSVYCNPFSNSYHYFSLVIDSNLQGLDERLSKTVHGTKYLLTPRHPSAYPICPSSVFTTQYVTPAA